MILAHDGQETNFAVVLTGKITSVSQVGHFSLYFSGVIVNQRGHYIAAASMGAVSLTVQFLH